jgi:hypothetical protein
MLGKKRLAVVLVVASGVWMAIASGQDAVEMYWRSRAYSVDRNERLWDNRTGKTVCRLDLAAIGLDTRGLQGEVDSSPTGRYAAIPGIMKHEVNPAPKGAFPCEECKPGSFDLVAAVVDVSTCTVVGVVNGGGSFLFSDDESILLASEDELVLYGGCGFGKELARYPYALLGTPANSVFNDSWGRWLYWFDNDYFAVRVAEDGGGGWLVIRKSDYKSSRLVPFANIPPLKYDRYLGDPKPARESEGEVMTLWQPVFADDRSFVVQYKTESRSKGKNTKQRQFLVALDYGTKLTATTELAPEAAEVKVARGADGQLSTDFEVAGKMRTATVTVPQSQRQ